MNWKEFFKPDLKIIIIYIFLFIFSISGFVLSQCTFHNMSTRIPEICWNPLFENPIVIIIMTFLTFLWYVIMTPVFLLTGLFQLNMTAIEINAMEDIFSIASIIILVVECYIISCLLQVLINDRIKRKK